VKGLAVALGLLTALTLVLQLTVGKENDFGFACFIVFCVAILALVGVGVKALVDRRRSAQG
jgi:hypothetical protein